MCLNASFVVFFVTVNKLNADERCFYDEFSGYCVVCPDNYGRHTVHMRMRQKLLSFTCSRGINLLTSQPPSGSDLKSDG